jgi:asparagine synthase (glutamine-hydrolysing)
MCGFVGVLRPRSAGPVQPETLRALLPWIRHRGPDQEDVFVRDGFGVAAARLRVRGGDEGDQPLVVDGGERVVAFNGELLSLGGPRCDTPALLRAPQLRPVGAPGDPGWEDDRDGALFELLRGNMAALAVYDRGRARLDLWRDPLGIKPLYTAEGDDDTVWFASEIAPLLRAVPSLRAARPRGLADLLAWHRPRDDLPFHGIEAVAPRSMSTYGLDPAGFRHGDGESAAFDLWSWRSDRLDAAEVVATVRQAWRAASRAAADVDGPVALFLSGGLDSSAAAAFSGRSDLLCLTGRFAPHGGPFDESAAAAEVARDVGLRHEIVELRDEDLVADLPAVVRALEMPIAGPGSLALWRMAKRARDHGRVVLTGTGGDELFCGYARTALALGRAGPWTRGYEPLRARIEAAGQDETLRLRAAFNRADDLVPVLDGDFLRSLPPPDAPEVEGWSSLLHALHQEEATGTLPSLLHVEDRVLMAHGVEGRPVGCLGDLDRIARSLPEAWLVGPDGEGKRALRAALAGVIPESVRTDPRKRGFPTPFARAARGAGRERVEDWFGERRFRERGWWNVDACRRLLDEERPAHDRALFAVLSWEWWARWFLDGDAFGREETR